MSFAARLVVASGLVVLGWASVQCTSGSPAGEAVPVAGTASDVPHARDWSSLRRPSRAAAGATSESPAIPEAPPAPPAAPPPSGSLWDWNLSTAAPVTASVAVYGASFTSSSSADSLFFGTATSGQGINAGSVSNYAAILATNNLFRLDNLYATTPSVVWYANTGGLDGSGIALNADGSKVYALDRLGVLRCFVANVASTGVAVAAPACAGFTNFTAGTVSLSSPWLVYGTGAIYFGDNGGRLYKVNGATGALIYQTTLNATYPVRSSPIVIDGIVYIGNDNGDFYRVIENAAGTGIASTASVNLCGGGACAAAWAIATGATLDAVTNTVYVAANDTVFEFPHSAGATWASSARKTLGTGGGSVLYSSPSLDYANGYLYVGYGNKLFKIGYPFAGSTTFNVYGTALAGAGPDGSYPHSSPLPYGGAVYIGNGTGKTEQYNCPTSGLAPSLTASTVSYGSTVETAPLVDFTSGNVNFGYTTGGGAGGVVQIAQAGAWGCPPSKPNSCGGAGCGGACGQCCVTADCSALPGTNCNNFVCITNCQTPSSSACGVVAEGATLTLTCPGATETIIGISYASYGTPTGVCSSFTNSACHATTSSSVVLAACNGLHSCNVAATNANFGDPCSGTTKKLAVVATCSTSPGSVCSSNNVTTPTCAGGVCTGTCSAGFADCNANKLSDGCEAATQTDPANCGACSQVCSGNHIATPTCAAGACTGACSVGYADCNANKLSDGCEGSNTCASCCGIACTTGQSCVNGACVAPATVAKCATTVENGSATVTCDPGYTITAVTYASYGTPTGACPGPFTTSGCNSATSVSYTSAQCVGRTTCTIGATNANFGDPCSGTFKNYATTVTCSPTVCP